MKKAFSIILAVLLVLAVVVSCNYDNLVDDMFGFVVTFDANGGTGTMESQRYTMEGGKLPANTFTYDGHLFGYWNTQKDGKGDSYVDGETVAFSQDTVLYAVWFIELTADTTELVAGKTYVNVTDDLSLTNRLSIRGDAEPVTIILRPDTVLKATKGIGVYGKQELIIDGPGKLVATGTDGNAGIGGVNEDDKRDAGTIYILDGIVVAEGAENAAGIGGGRNASGGIIVIDGGEVIALGGKDAAGIGSGAKTGSEEVNGGMITISGGYVLAVGGSHDDDDSQGGAGIGGGRNADSGDIAIGGTAMIRANGGGSKANGIGVGKGDGTPEEKAIEIDGVTIEVSEDGTTWTDYTGNNRNRFMKSYTLVSITFDANGATGGTPMDSQEVHTGVATTLNANTYENPGLFFFAWNTKADGTGTSYVNEGSITVEEDTTLYAQWTDAIPIDEETETLTGGCKYTVVGTNVINANRLSITPDGEKTTVTIILPAGSKLTLTTGITVETGKTLIVEGEGTLIATGAANCAGIGGDNQEGTKDCGTVIINGGIVQATGGTNAKGIGIGNGGTSDGTLKIGSVLDLYGGADKDNAPFLSGPTGTESYTGDRYAYMETKETTIGPTSPKITFMPNGGIEDAYTQTVPSGVAAQLTKNTFTHATNPFFGWNTEADGSGTPYTDKDTVTLTGDFTLYAQWGVSFTVDKSTVLEHTPDESKVVSDPTALPSGSRVAKYIMMANGPIWDCNGKKWITTTTGKEAQWKYLAYNNNSGYTLNASEYGETYCVAPTTTVTVIYYAGNGAYDTRYPSKSLMSRWGNPVVQPGTTDEYLDVNLFNALSNNYQWWSNTPNPGQVGTYWFYTFLSGPGWTWANPSYTSNIGFVQCAEFNKQNN